MAVWNVRVYGGKMQEVIKGMEQLKFTYHPSRKQKRQFLYQKFTILQLDKNTKKKKRKYKQESQQEDHATIILCP